VTVSSHNQSDVDVYLLCGDHDPQQSAHRRADPVDGLGAASRDQCGQRRQIRRKDVVVRVGEPVAVAAPRHVDRKHAMRGRERFRQHVEITSVAAHAMHADRDAHIGRIAPFVVDDAMKSVRGHPAQVADLRQRGGKRHGERNEVID